MRGRAAALTLAAGLVVIAAAQLGAPLGSPPLYDGVVVQDPYRYLAPAPGHAGAPTSFRSSPAVEGPTSPSVVAPTAENPPQAQLIAVPGSFALPPGTTSLDVGVEPIAAPAPPPGFIIFGNVYRVSVVADQSGTAVPISPGTLPTLILRAPDGVATATIWRLAGGSWQQLKTEPAGQPGMFITNVTALGDFALIGPPDAGPVGVDSGLIVLGSIAALLAVLVLGGLLLWRWRRLRAVSVPPRRGAPRPAAKRRDGRGRGSPR